MDIKKLMENSNVLSNEAVRYIEGYLLYLRKSRQDDPNETVEEVLSKHEIRLQELAVRELGGLIPEENIYREVASGEKIDEREEIQKVLSRIEDDDIKGVIVVEPSRLSRGDLGDCDRIIKGFQYTDTLVVTPEMTYDLKNKMARKFFQQKLLMSNEFLEYTKDILWSGRMASAKRGNFIASKSVFGYDKVRAGKDVTLEPNEDAEYVRMMFDWYVKDGMSPNKIARRMTEMGIPAPEAKDCWKGCSVAKMLKNPVYIGKVRFNNYKMKTVKRYGEHVKHWEKQPDEEVVYVEGKHNGIVDPEVFEAAQTRARNNARPKIGFDLQNPLSGILRCKKCGYVMVMDSRKNRGGIEFARFACRSHPRCYVSSKVRDVVPLVIAALEEGELPKLQLKLANGEGDSAVIQKRHIERLTKQLAELRDQEDKQYEFLETGRYTQEVFDRRNKVVREKIEECEKGIHLARQAMPQSVDYGKSVKALEDAIAALKDPDMAAELKNRALRSIVERIDYSATSLSYNNTEIHLDVYLKLK